MHLTDEQLKYFADACLHLRRGDGAADTKLSTFILTALLLNNALSLRGGRSSPLIKVHLMSQHFRAVGCTTAFLTLQSGEF
jgi:hypothetical protein